MIIHSITARQIGHSDVYWVDLPKYLGWRWSILASGSEAVEDIVRHKISDITGKGVAEFGIAIDWE